MASPGGCAGLGLAAGLAAGLAPDRRALTAAANVASFTALAAAFLLAKIRPHRLADDPAIH